MNETLTYGGRSSGTYDFAGGAGWTEITAADFTAAFGTPDGAFLSVTARPSDAADIFVSGTNTEAEGGHANLQIDDMARLNNGQPVMTLYVRGGAGTIDAFFTPR